MPLFKSKTENRVNKIERLDAEFSNAMTKAFLEEIKGFPFRKTKQLLPFDDVKERLELLLVKDIGIRTVPLNPIIGSQGRYKGFTRHFFPLDESLRERWKNVEKAIDAKRDLPPVELYKVCNVYFVKDGHHRISVTRARNIRSVEARVFEYDCDVSLNTDTDIEELTILETYHKFLKKTGLKTSRNPDLTLTRIGGYPFLMQQIQIHRHYLENRDGKEVSLQEASVSWYDNVYTPFVEIIKKYRIMEYFPHRTVTDFYIWVMRFREKEMEQFDGYEAESIVAEYTRIFKSPARRSLGLIKRIFGLVRY
jgi:hypothetical protein